MSNKRMTISLPASLYEAFETAALHQGIGQTEACRRIIYGLSNLTDADLRSMPEPPRKYRNRDVEIDVPCNYVDPLSQAANAAQLTISSVIRRVFYALLITRNVRFTTGEGESDFRLEITQLHFEFADDFEPDSPIPLRSVGSGRHSN